VRAYYIGRRATQAAEAKVESRPCAFCAHPVIVGEAQAATARACTDVACSHCSGLPEGSVFRPDSTPCA
jgi:hypothetical protein